MVCAVAPVSYERTPLAPILSPIPMREFSKHSTLRTHMQQLFGRQDNVLPVKLLRYHTAEHQWVATGAVGSARHPRSTLSVTPHVP